MSLEKIKDFDLKNTTIIKKSGDFDIEIGDSKQKDFKPQLKIMKWDNEVNFSIRAEEAEGATVETVGNIIKYITPDYEVHQYEKPEAGEDGGFEFEWVLNKKPKSNILSTTIQSKELNFFYQPELTQEEINEGAERPDNVVGSYAVYHKTKKNNLVGGKSYKTGKAFHIYRPEAVDAGGNKAWCDLHIDESILSVTVPQSFLDKAIYPVVVDPTFGYTSVGGSNQVCTGNDMYGTDATSGADADGVDLDSMSVYSYTLSNNINMKTLLVNTSEIIVTNGVSPATAVTSTQEWVEFIYSTPPTLSGSTGYILCFISDDDGGGDSIKVKFDSGVSGDGIIDFSNSYSSPTNPTDSFSNDDLYSIYATYTTGSPASSSNPLFIGGGI